MNIGFKYTEENKEKFLEVLDLFKPRNMDLIISMLHNDSIYVVFNMQRDFNEVYPYKETTSLLNHTEVYSPEDFLDKFGKYRPGNIVLTSDDFSGNIDFLIFNEDTKEIEFVLDNNIEKRTYPVSKIIEKTDTVSYPDNYFKSFIDNYKNGTTGASVLVDVCYYRKRLNEFQHIGLNIKIPCVLNLMTVTEAMRERRISFDSIVSWSRVETIN